MSPGGEAPTGHDLVSCDTIQHRDIQAYRQRTTVLEWKPGARGTSSTHVSPATATLLPQPHDVTRSVLQDVRWNLGELEAPPSSRINGAWHYWDT
jgi:hypothetical protein